MNNKTIRLSNNHLFYQLSKLLQLLLPKMIKITQFKELLKQLKRIKRLMHSRILCQLHSLIQHHQPHLLMLQQLHLRHLWLQNKVAQFLIQQLKPRRKKQLYLKDKHNWKKSKRKNKKRPKDWMNRQDSRNKLKNKKLNKQKFINNK